MVESWVGYAAYSVNELVILRTEYCAKGNYDIGADVRGGVSFEQYVTPGGIYFNISTDTLLGQKEAD